MARAIVALTLTWGIAACAAQTDSTSPPVESVHATPATVETTTPPASTQPRSPGPGHVGSPIADVDLLLPIATVYNLEEIFPSVEAMAADADVIVVGNVVAVDSFGTPEIADDPNPSEYFTITVAVTDDIKSDRDASKVSFVWEGFITRDEKRTQRVETDGIPMPVVGDDLLLFLIPEKPSVLAAWGAEHEFAVDTLDGILAITDDGKILAQVNAKETRPSGQIDGETLDEVVTWLRQRG